MRGADKALISENLGRSKIVNHPRNLQILINVSLVRFTLLKNENFKTALNCNKFEHGLWEIEVIWNENLENIN